MEPPPGHPADQPPPHPEGPEDPGLADDWPGNTESPDDPFELPQRTMPAAAAPNFCPSCGAPWEPAWTSCLWCAERAAQRQQGRERRSSPTKPVVSALGLYFVMLLTTIVVAAIVVWGDQAASAAGEVKAELAIGIVDSIIVLLWCAFSWTSIRSGLRVLAAGKWYLAAVGVALVTFALAGIAVEVLVRVFDIDQILYTQPFLELGYGWGLIILLVCVQPAVIEELAFRGVMLSALRRVLDSRDAIVVSALLFMVIHLTVLSFPHLFIIGLALGYLRVKTGSLYPGMLAHFVHNLLVVLAETEVG